MVGTSAILEQVRRRLRVRSRLLRECLAEFLGTFLLILIGGAAVAQVQTTSDGEYLSINIGYAAGVMFGIYAAGGISGAHLNPAVSVCFCALGKLTWWKLPFYILAQISGAFVGAAVIFSLYYDSIMFFTGGKLIANGDPLATGGIFATYPAPYLSTRNGFIDQVVATAILLLVILSLNDSRNNGPPDFLKPPLMGILVLVIGVAMGSNCGYAINPARDLGPRLFSYLIGYGSQVFTAGNSWWWVPVVAPVVGGLLGCFLYLILIEIHHEEEAEAEAEEEEVEQPGVAFKLSTIDKSSRQVSPLS